jgi:heme-degrading monooxygenase HmoA
MAPVIARTWKGAVRREDAEAYATYMRETGIAGYAGTHGNRGTWMLRRDGDDRTEFFMFTLWDSIEAIKAFAGEDYERAVFYPEDDRYLIERETTSTHYEVDTHVPDRGATS